MKVAKTAKSISIIIIRNLYRAVSMKIFNRALHKKLIIITWKTKPKFTMLKFLLALPNKKVLSLFLNRFVNRFRLEIDRMVDGRKFQSLGAAQLYDVSPKVILVLTFGDADRS